MLLWLVYFISFVGAQTAKDALCSLATSMPGLKSHSGWEACSDPLNQASPCGLQPFVPDSGWKGVGCLFPGRVNTLFFVGEPLGGSLPTQIGLLTDLYYMYGFLFLL